jgi:hypothetical protein
MTNPSIEKIAQELCKLDFEGKSRAEIDGLIEVSSATSTR